MASLILTSESLVESVKRRASVPENQSTFTEADFLALANEEMILGLVPSVLSYHEDYFLFQEETELQADKSEYDIPYRAIGNRLRELQFKDTNGHLYEMTRVSIGAETYYQSSSAKNRAYVFYVKNNRVRILPTIQGSPTGSLVFTYYIRPSELVAEDRIAIITAIDTGTGEITVDAVPDNFSININMDFYQVKSPHRPLSIDLTPTAVNSITSIVTFNPDDLPEELAIGDHLAQATECIIPQIPSDLHVVLAHRVAARVLESLGDTEGLQNANNKLAEMENKTGTLIDNRVEEAPIKVVNRHGPVRNNRFNRRYRRG